MPQITAMTVLKSIIKHPLFLMVIEFFAIGFAIAIPQVAAQAMIPPVARTDFQQLLVNIATALSCIAVYWFLTRFLERKPFTYLSLPGAAREWGMGAALGAGAMAMTIFVIYALGGYRVTGTNGVEVLTAVASMAVISGFTEEILLRGIVFRHFEQWLGSIAALAFSAGLFGVLHIFNPNASWLAAFAIAIEAGILLGAIYMLTGRLWAAIGLHMAWNAAQGGVFGVKVSGTDIDGLLISQPGGSDWVSGGAFGAEASLPAMVICTGLGLVILWRAHKQGRFVRMSWSRFKSGED